MVIFVFILIRYIPKKKTHVLKTLLRTAKLSKAKKNLATLIHCFVKNVYPYNFGSRVLGCFEYPPGKRRKFVSTFFTFQIHVLKLLFRSIPESHLGISRLNKH